MLDWLLASVALLVAQTGSLPVRSSNWNGGEAVFFEQAGNQCDLRLPVNFRELLAQTIEVWQRGFAHRGIKIGSCRFR